MARRSAGKRKAGFLGFQAGEIAFIEDEMAALAAEYGLQVDGEVAANVSKRREAKKARRRKPMVPSAAPASASQSAQQPQTQSQPPSQRVRLLSLQVSRAERERPPSKRSDAGGQQANVLAELRALLPEGGALGRCAVPGCSCSSGGRDLSLDAQDAQRAEERTEERASEPFRSVQCSRCRHGALQHALVVAREGDGKRDAALPTGGQQLLRALYALVRLVRVAGSVVSSREWTRSGMALLQELLTHVARQLATGGSQNGLKPANELKLELELVGELQALAKRAQLALGGSGRDELRLELACLCDSMYFRCYYASIVLFGRGCAAVPAPDAHLRQLLSLAPESAAQLEAFLNRELVVEEENEEGGGGGRRGREPSLKIVKSLALPLADADASASENKRALARFEDEYARNPLLFIHHARLQEGVRLVYEAGIGLSGEMDAVLASLAAGKSSSSSSSSSSSNNNNRKKPIKKHYRRERKAGSDAEASKAATSTTTATLSEMPSFPLLAQWRDNCRDWSCHLFAYATPTPEALDALAGCAPLVEVGAGTGYWSALLQQRGVDVVAFDKCPPSGDQPSEQQRFKARKRGEGNAYHGQVPPFCAVAPGGPEVLEREAMAGRNLLLCYPPPGDAMAADCARRFRGERLVHVGEWQGDTGDRRFERELACRFSLEKELALPNWGNSAYHLTIWRRRSRADAEPKDARKAAARSSALSCFACGRELREAARDREAYASAPFRRCALCKTNVYCSAACAASDRAGHAAEHAKRLVFLSDASALDFGTAAHFAPLADAASEADAAASEALDAQDAVAVRTSDWRAVVGGGKRDDKRGAFAFDFAA